MKNLFMILFVLQITAATTYSQMIEQWVSTYNNQFNGFDRGRYIAVDGSGNVYVTGVSLNDTVQNLYSSDYVTIKYNSSGVQQWVAIYDGPADSNDNPSSIGVDGSGNVYVTGSSRGIGTGGSDWATIKYDPLGSQLWVQRYNGPLNYDDVPNAMKVDALGNVYITGYGAVALGRAEDFVTIKYNSAGFMLWNQAYNGTFSNADQARAIAIDDIGNVYVAGFSHGGSTYYDYATVKYNSNGAQQWVQRYNGVGSFNDEIYAMTLDNLGDVIVTGIVRGGLSFYDYATIKYTSTGVQEWVAIYNGFGGSGSDGGYGIVADGSGNVYVSGNSATSMGYPTNVTVMYNSSGDTVWTRRINDIAGTDPFTIAYDYCLGYIYLAGTTFINGTIDYTVVRYNSYGDSLLTKYYNGTGNVADILYAVATDGLGNVYVTGRSDVSPTNIDIPTIKYTPASFFVHTSKRNNVNKTIEDNQSTSDSIFIDCSLMNYSTGDIRLNIDTLLHTRDSDLEILLINNGTTDNGGQIIDTLVFRVGGTGQNFIGTSFDDSASTSINSGTAPFTGSFRPHRPLSQLNGLGMSGNWILKINDKASGNTGVLKAWSIDFGMSSNTIGIQNISSEIPKGFLLSQNYPNPFNPVTNLEFGISKLGFVSLKIYNVLGKELATLVNAKLNPGTYKYEFDASELTSGIYFYTLKVNEFSETKKMILIK